MGSHLLSQLTECEASPFLRAHNMFVTSCALLNTGRKRGFPASLESEYNSASPESFDAKLHVDG